MGKCDSVPASFVRASAAAFMFRQVRRSSVIDVPAQDADEWQVPITLGKIQPVAYNEIVGNTESDIIRLHGFNAPGWFVEQHAYFDPPRFQCAQLRQHTA